MASRTQGTLFWPVPKFPTVRCDSCGHAYVSSAIVYVGYTKPCPKCGAGSFTSSFNATKVDADVVDDLEADGSFLERLADFIADYAWHDLTTCDAVDADGVWRKGNQACTCGYDESLASLALPWSWKERT